MRPDDLADFARYIQELERVFYAAKRYIREPTSTQLHELRLEVEAAKKAAPE